MGKKAKKSTKKSVKKTASKKSTSKKVAGKKVAGKKIAVKKGARTQTEKKKTDKKTITKEVAAKKTAKKTAKKSKSKKKVKIKRRAPGPILSGPPPRKPNPHTAGLSRAADMVREEQQTSSRTARRVSLAIAKHLEDIREMLRDQRRTLMEGVKREFNEARARDLDHIADESDMAADAADSDLALRLAEKESLEIAQIDDALQKIEDGTYGICERCNKPINAARVRALPFATMGIDCKRLQELQRADDEEDEWGAELQ